MDSWLFLVILAAIFIGWILGRWRPFSSKSGTPATEDFSQRYAKGLNYLLADDSDKAIEIFTDLIEVNRDTIEIHIALGNLFRSKGEVDRAIKVHQNLLARPNLTRAQRHKAIAELASDYLKAGLLDRAEKLYREMIVLDADAVHAYRRLLDLYVAEKSWEEAVDCAQALYRMDDPDANVVLSQCLCEVASQAMEVGNHRLARKSLDQALEVKPDCVRAALLLIQLHLYADEPESARRIFQRLTRDNPDYLPLFIEPARQIYQHRDGKVYQEFLQQEYDRVPSTQLAVALLEQYARNQQIDKARQFLADILHQSPSFEAFDFALRFLRSDPEQLQETWDSLSVYLKNLRDKKTEYGCANCGYESHVIQWLCPSCRHWATMKPLRT